MKIKTSIILSEELVESIDKFCSKSEGRSEFIEKAIRNYIKEQDHAERNLKDLKWRFTNKMLNVYKLQKSSDSDMDSQSNIRPAYLQFWNEAKTDESTLVFRLNLI